MIFYLTDGEHGKLLELQGMILGSKAFHVMYVHTLYVAHHHQASSTGWPLHAVT
jgi:hypothetical protein